MPPDLQISHDKQGTSYDDDLGQQWIDNTHLEASDVIVALGLNASDLEASVYDMLSTSKRRKAAVSLKGEAARHFLDILQNVRLAYLRFVLIGVDLYVDMICYLDY